MALVGPSRASVLSSLEVLVTLVLAFLLLGERLTAPQWAGAALILGAVAFQNAAALQRVLRAARVGLATPRASAARAMMAVRDGPNEDHDCPQPRQRRRVHVLRPARGGDGISR
jgi:hypothetical protein